MDTTQLFGDNNLGEVTDTSVVATNDSDSYLEQVPQEFRQEVINRKNAIKVGDTGSVQKLGLDVANASAKVSNGVSSIIKVGDAGQIGTMLNDMMKQTKSLDPSKLLNTSEPGFIGRLFGKAKNSIETFKNDQQTINGALTTIGNNLINEGKELDKNNGILKQMLVQNEQNIKMFAIDIAAGHIRINELETETIPALEQKARDSQQQEDINTLKEVQNFVRQLEVRVANLTSARAVALLNTPDLMEMINNNIMQCENINTMVTVGLPLWNTNINKYIINLQTRKSVEGTDNMSDHINEGLRAAAKMQGENTIMITEAVNRSIVKVETIEFMQNELLTTMDKCIQINNDGKQKRKESAAKLLQMEQELKQKLLS